MGYQFPGTHCPRTGIPLDILPGLPTEREYTAIIHEYFNGQVPVSTHSNEYPSYFDIPITHKGDLHTREYWAEQDRQVRTSANHEQAVRARRAALEFLREVSNARHIAQQHERPQYHPYRRVRKATSFTDLPRKPSTRTSATHLPSHQNPPCSDIPPPAPRPNTRLPLPDVATLPQVGVPTAPSPAHEQEQLPVSHKRRQRDLDDLAAAAFQQHYLTHYTSADAPLGDLEAQEAEWRARYPEWYTNETVLY